MTKRYYFNRENIALVATASPVPRSSARITRFSKYHRFMQIGDAGRTRYAPRAPTIFPLFSDYAETNRACLLLLLREYSNFEYSFSFVRFARLDQSNFWFSENCSNFECRLVGLVEHRLNILQTLNVYFVRLIILGSLKILQTSSIYCSRLIRLDRTYLFRFFKNVPHTWIFLLLGWSE